MQDSSPATMSIAFLHPVFDALLERGLRKDDLAAQLSLSASSLYNPEIILPANIVYTFLGWATNVTGNPHFNALVGQAMAAGGWAPLVPLMSSSRTVGDFFQKFSHLSSKQGRAVIYRLEVEGAVAVWRMTRPSGTNANARFADAFAAGFFVQILKMAAKTDWDTTQVVAVLADAALIPYDLLPPISVLTGEIGLKLRFPSDCLGLDMPEIAQPVDIPELALPDARHEELQERVRQLIEARISEPNLGVSSIATGIGLSQWQLQSSLRAVGTSVSVIKEQVREGIAVERVAKSTDPIGSIATDLGYTNSSNFTRAFRGWTGKTPRQFRSELGADI